MRSKAWLAALAYSDMLTAEATTTVQTEVTQWGENLGTPAGGSQKQKICHP
jgi:hypothetical protein